MFHPFISLPFVFPPICLLLITQLLCKRKKNVCTVSPAPVSLPRNRTIGQLSPRVTNLYFPTFSAPCSIFPSLPTLSVTLFIDFPQRRAWSLSIFLVEEWNQSTPLHELLKKRKKKERPLVYYQEASSWCSSTHLLMFSLGLCSLMAGPWPASIYAIDTLPYVLKETIYKWRNCCSHRASIEKAMCCEAFWFSSGDGAE